MGKHRDISGFFVVGINYKKTDGSVRGLYAINTDQYALLLTEAANRNLTGLFVISTCNRTEIYGFADKHSALSSLLCDHTEGNWDDFDKRAYIKQGEEAIRHLFSVAAGLDSQILGDYEIVGQIKQAVKFSKEQSCLGAYLERMANAVFQSSKEIKTTTRLSGGTVSVSFAAVQYIKDQVRNIRQKRILLIGTGKIGKSTCRNLVDYLHTQNITLMNRTDSKAEALAAELGVDCVSSDDITSQIKKADIILVATNASDPVILPEHLQHCNDKLIIDLSIPYNVHTAVKDIPGITLVNVDELSRLKDETLLMRRKEVPKAKIIIEKHIAEFMEWYAMRRHVPVLKAVKTKLEQLHYTDAFSNEHFISGSIGNKERIQKVINSMASKMRTQNNKGCYYIEAINEYIATGTNEPSCIK